MAIGKAKKYAMWDEELDDFRPADVVNFSISADHRILEGATVAKFAKKMSTYLENPNAMIISMH